MRPEDILAEVNARPFRPFRLHLVSGKTFDIEHPEFMKVGRSTVQVFFADAPDRPFDRYEVVALLLIERIEPLERVSAS